MMRGIWPIISYRYWLFDIAKLVSQSRGLSIANSIDYFLTCYNHLFDSGQLLKMDITILRVAQPLKLLVKMRQKMMLGCWHCLLLVIYLLAIGRCQENCTRERFDDICICVNDKACIDKVVDWFFFPMMAFFLCNFALVPMEKNTL